MATLIWPLTKGQAENTTRMWKHLHLCR